MPASKATKIALYGGGLIGVVLLIHYGQRWLAQRKLDELRRKAVAGQIPTRQFLDAVLASGEPVVPGAPRVTIEEAKRLPCEQIFGPVQDLLVEGTVGGFNFFAALADLKRSGACL